MDEGNGVWPLHTFHFIQPTYFWKFLCNASLARQLLAKMNFLWNFCFALVVSCALSVETQPSSDRQQRAPSRYQPKWVLLSFQSKNGLISAAELGNPSRWVSPTDEDSDGSQATEEPATDTVCFYWITKIWWWMFRSTYGRMGTINWISDEIITIILQ